MVRYWLWGNISIDTFPTSNQPRITKKWAVPQFSTGGWLHSFDFYVKKFNFTPK